MVKVCSISGYPKDSENKYKQYFEKYDYPLHIFQKWAIEGIIEGNHVLVTAPTGSGKTLPSEFAIDYFHSIKKKTIYCSPIKALSNQKFYDFGNKYPHISIGLVTGDIKTNTNADILIMTTEILLNKLYQLKSKNLVPASAISFEMDIENELGCVVFDEIHMINDESRGHVWENCIMLLPEHIQMIGLSATLDNPDKFAHWLETKGQLEKRSDKIVYLCSKKDRAVPLTHYSFITVPNGIFKAIKDKQIQEEIKGIINKPFVIQTSKGEFNEVHYFKMNKMLKLFESKNIYVKRQLVLDQVAKHLVENNMLPALCYVFSRKQLEICAREMNTILLEDDSKVRYIVHRECEQILRKLPNFQEYLQLPEYHYLLSLLEKGVAIHHSGMMSVFREIVELLFVKGYIKMLFCTESVSIGLNLPVKTTIFTDINKHDGKMFRILQGHEFVQASGRAGRLGIDTVGHVIHLNNLFRNVDSVNYKQMMTGKPQTLISKFKISYNLLLNLIDIGDNKFIEFARKSMVKDDIDNQLGKLYQDMAKITNELDDYNITINNCKTPSNIIYEYIELNNEKVTSINKKRKEIDRKISNIFQNYKTIESDKKIYEKKLLKIKEYNSLKEEYDYTEKYIDNNVITILKMLESENYIMKDSDNEGYYKLSTQGILSTHIREVHCLVFSKLINNNTITNLDTKQLVAILSCFTNITVPEDLISHVPSSKDNKVQELILEIKGMYQYYCDIETKNEIHSGIDYHIHYDLLNYVERWCDCENVQECKLLLQDIAREKEIFLGEFVKALLKINNISNELEKIAELIGNIAFLSKLKEIQNITLKYVVTNQSLYV